MITHRDWVKRELEKFIDRFGLHKGTNKKVLDIGCGMPIDFKIYFESIGYEYVGLDNDEKCKNSYIINGDMFKIPSPNNYFDIIFSCHAFEHSTNPINSLKEMLRVTKKYIFIATPYPCEQQILKADYDHIFVMNVMQMKRLFAYCGIRTIDIYVDDKQEKEQDWNIISIGEK